jgi:hypothetical protein
MSSDNDGSLVTKPRDRGQSYEKAGTPRGVETEVLVQVVVIKPADRRLEDVSGGHRARRNAPAPVPKEQRGLGLRAGETELAGERLAQPGYAWSSLGHKLD